VKSNWHCSNCGRPIRARVSILRGMGPICWLKTGGHVQMDLVDELSLDIVDLTFDEKTRDIVFHQDPHDPGRCHFNIPHRIVKHSPTGMSWGYGGSGPSDFAINILSWFTDPAHATDPSIYHKFKFDVVATMPPQGGVIPGDHIRQWLADHDVPGL